MNLIDTYLNFTANDNTPLLFRKWAAVFSIAAAAQRRYWIITEGQKTFLNLYVILCGPSAAGKGIALTPLRLILEKLTDQYIALSSITTAALADELADAKVTVFPPQGAPVMYNCLTIASREFSVFLPQYDQEKLSVLTDVFDNKGYEERRRGRKEKIYLPNATLNIIGGTTPAYFANTLPETAWEEGFMSRCIVVFASGLTPRPIRFDDLFENETSNLITKYQKLTEGYGRIIFCKSTQAKFNEWFIGGCQPRPTHYKLNTYNNRRHFHILKLCAIRALGSYKTTVESDDFEWALGLLVETEAHMSDAFKAIKSGGDGQAIQEAAEYVRSYFIRRKTPIPRQNLISFLSSRVPAHSVAKIIDNMVEGGILSPRPGNQYLPVMLTDDD